MQLPDPVLRLLIRWVDSYTRDRAPDRVIGGCYLLRWYVTPWRRWSGRFWQWLPNLYLHIFARSDYDQALHDHPWPSVSIVLEGGYYEHVPTVRRDPHASVRQIWRAPGAVTVRRAHDRHRIELNEHGDSATTLFLTGFRRRRWGFHCREGFRDLANWERNGGCDE